MKINGRFVKEQLSENAKFKNYLVKEEGCTHEEFCVISRKVSREEFTFFENEEILNIIEKAIEFEENHIKRNGNYEIKVMQSTPKGIRVLEFRDMATRQLETLRIHIDLCQRELCKNKFKIKRIVFYTKLDQTKVLRNLY